MSRQRFWWEQKIVIIAFTYHYLVFSDALFGNAVCEAVCGITYSKRLCEYNESVTYSVIFAWR